MSIVGPLINHPRLSRLRAKLHFVRLAPFDVSTPEGRSDERHRRIALSSAASALARVISILTGLISIPLTLHYLGPELYGMWLIIVSFTALFSFADLGMGNGVLNQVSHAYGRDDDAAIHRVVSSGYGVLTSIACVILLGFGLAYPFVPWAAIFNVKSPDAQAQAGPAVAAFVGCFALAIPLGIVQKVQMGLQRSFLASLWQCGASVMSLAGLLVVIHFHGGLMWLTIAIMGAPLIVSLLNSMLFFGHLMPGIRPRASLVSLSVVRAISQTGILFFVLQIVSSVAFNSDGLVIAQVLGVSAVPQFSVPERLFALVSTVIQMMLSPLWPAYGEAMARNHVEWARKTLKHSAMLAGGAAFAGASLLILFSPLILHYWVGDSVKPPLMLIFGFGVWKVLEAVGNSLAMFLNGANVVGFQIVVSVLMGITALTLKIFLVHRLGVAGSVWATIVAFSIVTLVPNLLKVKSILCNSV